MRYLTHETEDPFWLSHGAKPHPLAKAEEEKRSQIKREQQQALENTTPPRSRVVFAEPDQMSNSSKVSNGSSRSLESPGVFSEQTHPSAELNGSTAESLEQNADTPTSAKHRKDYMSMSDEDILKAQKHAERVGYKVSTV